VPFEGARARIYDLDGYHSNGPTYTVDFRLDEWSGARKSAIDCVCRKLLGRLAARNVTADEGHD
jgi:hypothetical protein